MRRGSSVLSLRFLFLHMYVWACGVHPSVGTCVWGGMCVHTYVEAIRSLPQSPDLVHWGRVPQLNSELTNIRLV